jgi:hypothetical protein
MILFKRQIDILSFKELFRFFINRKSCLLFHMYGEKSEWSTILKYLKKKKGSTLKYTNLSLLKWFRGFLTSGSCRLQFKVK